MPIKLVPTNAHYISQREFDADNELIVAHFETGNQLYFSKVPSSVSAFRLDNVLNLGGNIKKITFIEQELTREISRDFPDLSLERFRDEAKITLQVGGPFSTSGSDLEIGHMMTVQVHFGPFIKPYYTDRESSVVTAIESYALTEEQKAQLRRSN